MRAVGQKIELFVGDLEVSRDFYRRVLGFEQMKGGHMTLTNGPVIVALDRFDRIPASHHLKRSPNAPRGIGVEFCLYVEEAELESWYERARRESSLPVEPLQRRSWGARDFRVVDPDGYYIRISGPNPT
jgi:lactoylglutathione lyase